MNKKLEIKRPEDYLSVFWHRVQAGGKPMAGAALLSALISALVAYHLLIITGHGNPDAVCEGLVCYSGADWALACGRWATRYMNELSGNVIIPGLWVLLYALCCGFTTIILSRLWKIESKLSICLISVLLTVNPTVIEQSLLQYMFMAWGISNLVGALFVYLCCTDGHWSRKYLLAPLCMAVAFGLYQACVSMMCLCFCITLILKLMDGDSLKDMLITVFKFALSALVGVVLYFGIMELEIIRYGVDESSRVDEFSLMGILGSLPQSFPNAYKTFFAYFVDHRFWRTRLYVLLFAIAFGFALWALIKLVKKRRILEALAAVLLAALIPAFSNISDIIFPYNIPVLIMQYQSMLVVPFSLALIHRADLELPQLANLSRIVASLLLAALAWGYIVAANTTYRVYELTYRNTYFTVSAVLEEIYDLPGYSEDEVIAFAGYPSDSYLRNNIDAYKQAYGQYENLVFWPGVMGLQNCRQNYLLNYFGIDGGYIRGGWYNDAVRSEEFKAMPVWPAEGSIQRINELIIVKFEENPPIFD